VEKNHKVQSALAFSEP